MMTDEETALADILTIRELLNKELQRQHRNAMMLPPSFEIASCMRSIELFNEEVPEQLRTLGRDGVAAMLRCVAVALTSQVDPNVHRLDQEADRAAVLMYFLESLVMWPPQTFLPPREHLFWIAFDRLLELANVAMDDSPGAAAGTIVPALNASLLLRIGYPGGYQAFTNKVLEHIVAIAGEVLPTYGTSQESRQIVIKDIFMESMGALIVLHHGRRRPWPVGSQHVMWNSTGGSQI